MVACRRHSAGVVVESYTPSTGIQRPEEGSGSPGAGVTRGCELQCGFWEQNLGPPQDQEVLSH